MQKRRARSLTAMAVVLLTLLYFLARSKTRGYFKAKPTTTESTVSVS